MSLCTIYELMFGINYAFISSNRHKRTVNCNTVYTYETRQRNKHSQSSHEGSASWLSWNPVMMLCHCDIYRLNSSPFCHTIHFNTIYSAGFQCTCQEKVTNKRLISRSSVDLISHSLTLIFLNLIYVNMYLQYVTVLCMISSLKIHEKDWVGVLELLASPLGRNIWSLVFILWAGVLYVRDIWISKYHLVISSLQMKNSRLSKGWISDSGSYSYCTFTV